MWCSGSIAPCGLIDGCEGGSRFVPPTRIHGILTQKTMG